ncbi:MAG: phage portal protein [Clostridia bacterium]
MRSYSEFSSDIYDIVKIIDEYKSSRIRNEMKIAKKYYQGHNVTIHNVKKMICVEVDGKYQNVVNPFVSNAKLPDKFVEDMVHQKVFTLFDRSPNIEGVNEDTKKVIKNTLDYALQQMGVECSLCGVSYAYVEHGDKLKYKVFDSENCIGFFDDVSEELMAMVRFWKSKYYNSEKTIKFAEVYEENTYRLYKCEDTDFELLKKKSYLVDIEQNAIMKKETEKNWKSGIPIVVMKNDKYFHADFDNSTRAQTDIIDIVSSDFANNLSDFQEAFWIIKGLDEISAADMGQFMRTIKNTNKAALPEGADIDMKTIDIPYQARIAFLNEMKQKRIENSGVINTDMVMKGSLTNIAIKLSSQKLMLRVSRFEYEAYKTALRMIEFAKEYAKDNSTEEVTITFFKSYISNDTEVIANLTMSIGQISQETYLQKHPYVDDAEEEMDKIKKEGVSKLKLPEVKEVVEDEV